MRRKLTAQKVIPMTMKTRRDMVATTGDVAGSANEHALWPGITG